MGGLAYFLVLVIFIGSLVVLLLGVITLKKRGLRSVFAALMTAFLIVNFCWLFGPGGFLGIDPSFYSLLGGSATVLTFPMATFLILMFLHPRNLVKQISTFSLLMIPAVVLGSWASQVGVGATQVYEIQYVYLFVILCICLGLVESIWGWLGSRTVRNQCYLFILAFLVLFATGPLYDYELEMLGFWGLRGASLGAPIVGAFILAPLVMANPMPFVKTPYLTISKSRPSYDLKQGRCYGISEKRPKYCYTLFKDLSDSGYTTMVLTSSDPGRLRMDLGLTGSTVIGMTSRDTSKTLKATNLGRVLFTLTDFAEKNRKPVMLLDCLHYMLSNNDTVDVAELIQKLIEPIERNDGVLIMSFSLMTKEEKETLLGLDVVHLQMPPPEDVISRILSAHLGDLSEYLLKLSSRMMNKKARDFTVEDIPELSSILAHSMRALGNATNEEAILRNWERQVIGLRQSLASFQNAPIAFLSSDGWMDRDPLDWMKKPQRRRPKMRMVAGQAVIPKALATTDRKGSLHDEVSGVFVDSLGDFGGDLLRMECANLGIEPKTMTKEDVEMLADSAVTIVSEMGGFVNVESANGSMKATAENLKKGLGRIFQETVEWYPE